MTWANLMIPLRAEKCSDCTTIAGQAFCTMNCGPRVELPTKKGTPCRK